MPKYLVARRSIVGRSNGGLFLHPGSFGWYARRSETPDEVGEYLHATVVGLAGMYGVVIMEVETVALGD